MAAPRDYVTVLTAQGRKILAKRHRRLPNGGGGVTMSYDKATMFRLSQRPVSSIDDIAELLRELAGKPSSCIVRGDPRLISIGASRKNGGSKHGGKLTVLSIQRHWSRHRGD